MASSTSKLNNYRQALLPVAVDAETCRDVLVNGRAQFLDWVLSQDLGPLWHHHLQSAGLLESLPAATAEALSQARRSSAAAYLAQRAALTHIDELFERAGIAYVVMKGAHVRERVYPDPSIRVSSDLDVLVAATDRRRAAQTLIDAGYSVRVELDNISHEASFTRHPIDIDLHWNILRPGRTRIDMTAGFLARRQRLDGYWGLSDSDTLFLMLTHPAFAKYVCSPNMGLARVADFLLWIQQRPVDWAAVLQLLGQAGLKTAAWTMLSWFRMLAAPPATGLIDGWLAGVQPGKLRAAYLEYWLRHDLPSRWLDRPLPIQIGFTLFMHDRPSDALRALKGWWHARRNIQEDARLLLGDQYAVDRQVR